MSLYEITQDCRIANKDYKKGDVVSKEEVGWYFTTVMKEISDDKKPCLKDSPAKEEKAPEIENADEEDTEKESEKAPISKKQSKKK